MCLTTWFAMSGREGASQFRRCGSTTMHVGPPGVSLRRGEVLFTRPVDTSWRYGQLRRQGAMAERTCTRGEELQPGDRLELLTLLHTD